MARGENWSWEETLMAFGLYFLTGPSPSKNDPNVIALASALDRTVGSVGRKIGNISANDKNQIALGKKGCRNGSKYDRIIWEKYEENDEILSDALNIFNKATAEKHTSSQANEYAMIDFRSGDEKTVMAKYRISQDYFRQILMTNYSGRCCMTNLGAKELLVASHIKPWSKSDPKTERLAASNGLLLNALHDKAFDRGLITIDTKLTIRVSKKVKKNPETSQLLWSLDGKSIQLPKIHTPAKEFIEYHNDLVFRG